MAPLIQEIPGPGARRFDARLLAEAAALGANGARLRPVGRRPRDGYAGAHGRRRVGPGAAFWQYRPYAPGEPARLIDWRRSARSDQPIVREREWEAALTLDLWVDSSRSMAYPTAGGPTSKRRVADLLALAAAAAWLKNGERIRVLGDPKRRGLAKLSGVAAALARADADDHDTPEADAAAGLPPRTPPPRRGFVLLIGDFLMPPDLFVERAATLAAAGARGVALQTLHPDETSLDVQGRVEFESLEGGESHLLRQVEAGRDVYARRLEAHRQALAHGLARIGWSMISHRTDRPHGPALLAALAILAEGD